MKGKRWTSLCPHQSAWPPDMMMIGGSGVFCHLDSFTVTLDLMSYMYIQCSDVFLDVK